MAFYNKSCIKGVYRDMWSGSSQIVRIKEVIWSLLSLSKRHIIDTSVLLKNKLNYVKIVNYIKQTLTCNTTMNKIE